MSTLRIRVVGREDQWVELPRRGKLVVGSSEDRADFVVEGQGVDAAHCAIGRIKSGGWAVKDLGSKYGTILNDRPVETARVSPGDRLIVGSRSLEVFDPEDAAAPTPPAAPTPVEPSERRAPEPGKPAPSASSPSEKRLGGFRLDRQLGRGGMGEVWLALQESLNRPVALKILSTKLAGDAEFVAQFQREARAAAALSHPNVVVVHDVGEADGHHFLAMEFMAGGSLEDRVAREGPLPWRQVLDALHDAGKGLTFAEERKIVHRDIKPANLMVGGQGTIKIADLGLATQLAADEGAGEDAKGKKILGTPHFIAPEQARGEAVDQRADLYSLGATAYRLLTGRTPFEGDTTREILRGHLTREPAPPSSIVPGLPEGLEALVLKLLAKDPADRFSSAKELVTAVDRLRLEADHVQLPDLSAKKGGLGKILVPVVLLLAVGGGAYAVLGGDRSAERGGDRGGDDRRTGEPSVVEATGSGGLDPAFFAPEDTGSDEETAASEAALEADLRVQDLEAQLAYRDVAIGATPSERVEALRAIVETYPGTATATLCADEIGRLEQEIVDAARAAQQLGGLLESSLDSLRADVGWPPAAGTVPRPIDSLRAFDAFSPPESLVEQDAWTDSVARLRAEVLRESERGLRARFEQTDEPRERGDFDAVERALASLLSDLELPAAAPEAVDSQATGPDELAGLRALATEVRAARDALDTDRARFADEVDASRRARLASALGPGSGASEAFASLDLDGVAARVQELADAADGTLGAALRETLEAEHADAGAALDALVDGWSRSQWRRKSLVDPRDAKRRTGEVLAVDRTGLRLQLDGDAQDVSWGAFGEDPCALEQLFKGRLDRAYDETETRGILALLRWALAARTARACERGFEADALKSGDAKALEECFAVVPTVLDWDGTDACADARRRLAGELEACRMLERALLAAKDGAWAEVVTALESAYRRHGDALVVRLLSDGTAWQEDA